MLLFLAWSEIEVGGIAKVNIAIIITAMIFIAAALLSICYQNIQNINKKSNLCGAAWHRRD